MSMVDYFNEFVVVLAMTLIIFAIVKSEERLREMQGIAAFLMLFLYEMCQSAVKVHSISHLGKVVCILLLVIMMMKRKKNLWNIPRFFSCAFITRIFCLLTVFIYIAVSSKLRIELIEVRMKYIESEPCFIFLLLCIPAGICSKLLQKNYELIPEKQMNMMDMLFMAADFIFFEVMSWQVYTYVLGVVLLYVFILLIYRQNAERKREQELYYNVQLKEQMLRKNQELEQLRKEVMTYYERCSGKEAKAYSQQVLTKLDDVLYDEIEKRGDRE